VRVLITGASGFAGAYLARACHEAGEEVLGISRTGAPVPGCAVARALDLVDADAVRATVADWGPDVVYHLAALSSVGRSWQEPERTMQENVQGAVALLEAVRHEAPAARVVWVSSCEVYGPQAPLPTPESAPLEPASPYAVSKAAGDMLAGVYADAYGLQIVRARPYSHSGPGQRPIFLLSSLARQAAGALVGGEHSLRVITGNPDTRRDFTDVRDVARAYRLLAEPGNAGVFNVCSGRSVSAAEQVSLLAELVAPIEVEHVVDPALVRPHEVSELRGSHERITAATGWEPEIPLRQTMADTIAWWQHQLAPAPAGDAVRH
jgi:GDP-4-dehydro-6-deoxy-D-mannose reductase